MATQPGRNILRAPHTCGWRSGGWRSAASLIAAGFLVALSGCGGGASKDNSSSTASASSGQAAGATAPPLQMDDAAADAGQTGGVPGDAAGGQPGEFPGGAAGEAAPVELKLPEKTADWSPDDFRKARKAGHQGLIAAITQRAAKTKQDSKYAELWRELLAIKPEGGGAGFPGAGFPGGGVPPGGEFGDGGQPGFPGGSAPPLPSGATPGAGAPGAPGGAGGAAAPPIPMQQTQRGFQGAGGPGGRGGGQIPPGAGQPPPGQGGGRPGGGQIPPGAGQPPPGQSGPGGPGGGGRFPPGGGQPGAAGGAAAPGIPGQDTFPGGPDGFGADGSGFGGGGDVVKALIDALGANNTDVARLALVDVIKGKVPTEVDDATQTSYAVAALLANMNPQREATVLELLTKPQSFRQGGQSVTPAALQQQAIAALETGTFPSLRKKLADAIPTLPAAGQKPLVDVFLKVRADNIESQVALFTSPRIDEGAKKSLINVLSSVTRQTYLVVLGMPPEGMSSAGDDQQQFGGPGGRAPPGAGAPGAAGPGGVGPPGAAGPGGQPGFEQDGTQDPSAGADNALLTKEDLLKAAPLVWSDAMVGEVEKRLTTGKLTADNMRLLELAAAIPATSIRAKFQRLLARPFDENPRKITKLRVFEDVLRDPGLLLVVKNAPREDRPIKPPRRRGKGNQPGGYPGGGPGQPGAGAPGAGGPGGPGGPGGDNDDDNAVLNPKELKYRWMDTVDDAVTAMMAQMNYAAVTREADPSSYEDMVKTMSVKKPKEARINAALALNLPDDLGEGADKCGQLDLKVRYAAFTQYGRPATVKTAYGGQVRSGKPHFTRGDYYWYEGVAKKGDSLISVDVMVSVGKYRSAQGADDAGAGGNPGGFGGQAPGIPGGAGFGGQDGGEQVQKTDAPASLFIEVLEIEIRNPNPPGVAAK
ncbi:MAG: hypothetical protein HYS13_07945 [Planctomycetia bacterium]|nr:hypothetical protein [Planctomycetia bacterium]